MVRVGRRIASVLMLVLLFLCPASLPTQAQAQAQAQGQAQGHAQPQERLALVVGNGTYRNVPALANAGNDARLIARSLEAAGFVVIGGGPKIDVTRPQLEALIREFGRRLTPGTTALFYYAGHGVQIGGHNYLVPIEANVASASDVKYELVDAEFVLDEMSAAGNRLNLVLLDACRNNPFAGRGLRGGASGLAQVTAPGGTIIGYATQPGAVAADGDGSNSPYSAALARAMALPGTNVLDALNTVGVEVQRATAGRQLPWLALSPLSGQFYFTPQPEQPQPQPQLQSQLQPQLQPQGATARYTAPPAPPPLPATPLPATPLPATPVQQPPPPETRRQESCPLDYDGFFPDSPPLACGCTVEAVTPGRSSVFGDLVYANGSSLCLAARHAGAVTGRGGEIVVTPAATPAEDPPYPAILRNGIQSYGTRPSGTSFRVAAPGAVLPPLPPPSTADMRLLEFCPQNYHEFPADGPALTCSCTLAATTPGSSSVIGDQVYSGQSSLCLAARHAGAIPPRGGRIVVTPVPTPEVDVPFPSVLRYGIQSYSGAPLGPSFRVASASPPPDPVARPVQAPIAETLRAQGRVQVYINFETGKASLQPGAEPVLRELFTALSSRPDLRVDLIGHTDAVGAVAYNQDLSARRAATVQAWLVQRGITPSRLRSSGRGFAEPIGDNGSDAGRALNRRVEVRALE